MNFIYFSYFRSNIIQLLSDEFVINQIDQLFQLRLIQSIHFKKDYNLKKKQLPLHNYQ